MEIKTIWGWRAESEGPELLDAWDELVVDENPDGYRDAVTSASRKYDIDPSNIREITLVVNYEAIERAFMPVEVSVEVGSS